MATFQRSSLSKRHIQTVVSRRSRSDDECWLVPCDNRGIQDNSFCANYRVDGGTLSWEEKVEGRVEWALDAPIGCLRIKSSSSSSGDDFLMEFQSSSDSGGRRSRKRLRRSPTSLATQERLKFMAAWATMAGTFHSSLRTASQRSVATSSSSERPPLSVLLTADA
ncbi:hypothetical protein BDN67DRAFT_1016673 [Paxillus ammoniavirescens]|nr:hypothetical protein BDN67DRAFT_1016673 [Paxillus ammoniavirescens]